MARNELPLGKIIFGALVLIAVVFFIIPAILGGAKGVTGMIVPIIGIAIFALILVIAVLMLINPVLVGDDEVGIVTRKMLGKPLEQGQIIARADQIGTQAKTLKPGLHIFPRFIFGVDKVETTKIGEHQVGLVTSIDGDKLDPGRIFGKIVECDNFQDAVAFFANGGQQGPQLGKLKPREYRINTALFHIDIVAAVEIAEDQVGLVEANDGFALDPGRIFGKTVECDNFQDETLFFENGGQRGPQVAQMKPGIYRVNTKLFNVTILQRTDVPDDKVAVIIAQDGIPLPPGYVIAPMPKEGDGFKNHQYFQDGQAFLDAEGYRGPQEVILQGGKFYINTWLFKVMQYDFAEVPPGFVAVLRSNLGSELVHEAPKAIPAGTEEPPIHDIEEVVLSTDKRKRGIYIEPVATGKYPLNPFVYTPYLVPVSAVTIDWAAQREEGRELITSVSGKERLRVDEVKNKRAEEFFNFNQLSVISSDGFTLDVDVRLIIRIPPEYAAYIIARFGSVKNLIEQIIHPLIDSSFRNEAGKMKAIKFVQSRHELMDTATKKAEEVFNKYHIETQNLLVAYIAAPPDLLKTQTDKEIAVQEVEMYEKQTLAKKGLIEVKKQEAISANQMKLQTAMVSVEIAQFERDAKMTKADGEAYYSQTTRQGEAKGVQYMTDTIGANNATKLQFMDRVEAGGIKIVPDIFVAGKDGEAGSLLTAWLANNLHEDKFERREIPVIPKPESKDEQPTAETTTETTIKTTTVQTETKTDKQAPVSTGHEPVVDPTGEGLSEAIKPYGEAAKEGEKKDESNKTEDY